MVVRTAGDPRQFIQPVINAIHDVDPEQPAYDVQPLETAVERTLTQRWLNMLLLIAFATVSLTLASIGLYGVMAYAVTQRTREFGIRLALGAEPGDVTRLVLTQAATLAIAGVTLGLAMAWLATRALQSLLFNVGDRRPDQLRRLRQRARRRRVDCERHPRPPRRPGQTRSARCGE